VPRISRSAHLGLVLQVVDAASMIRVIEQFFDRR
jgi:hypothetical protein